VKILLVYKIAHQDVSYNKGRKNLMVLSRVTGFGWVRVNFLHHSQYGAMV